MMNQVNPKAGTLKQTNGRILQNVSTKLIAFVLMLAITLQPRLVSAAANDDNGDTCCAVDKKAKVNKLARLVKLEIPSSESVKKADIEMTSNLYRSLNESKIGYFATAFAIGDAEMNKSFKAETSISTPASAAADEVMESNFRAENIAIAADVNVADENIDALFTVNEKGLVFNNDSSVADDWMNIKFQAEHIALPSTEMIGRADYEINSQNHQKSAHTVAIK